MYLRIICVRRAGIFRQVVEIGHQIRVRVLGEVQTRVLEYRNGEAATRGHEGRAGEQYRGGRRDISSLALLLDAITPK